MSDTKEIKSDKEFMLTKSEVDFLGCWPETLNKKTNIKQIYIGPGYSWFGMGNIDYVFNIASSRFVGFSCKSEITYNEPITVKKYRDGNGFFPSVATQEVCLKFRTSYSALDEHCQSICDEAVKVKCDIEIDKKMAPESITIKNKSPETSILVFDFGCHNFGFSLFRWEH